MNNKNQYKNFHPDKIKIAEKSYKYILIYYIGYATIKDLKYVKINSVNPYFQKSEWILWRNQWKSIFNTTFYWWKKKKNVKMKRPVEQNQSLKSVNN